MWQNVRCLQSNSKQSQNRTATCNIPTAFGRPSSRTRSQRTYDTTFFLEVLRPRLYKPQLPSADQTQVKPQSSVRTEVALAQIELTSRVLFLFSFGELKHRTMAVSSKSPMAILVLALVVPFLVQGSLAQVCGSQAGGALCSGSNCCSQYGYCGVGDAWCGAGCQSGPCTSGTSGRCGKDFGNSVCSGGLCCSQYGYCGSTTEHCTTGCQSQCTSTTPSPPSGSCGTGVGGVVSQSTYNSIFPNKNAIYTYQNFITAAASFPTFGTTGDCTMRKKEIAAFFAQISHETSGLFYTEEINKADYCQASATYPCAPGKQYFGRGPMQLSWNYNYKQCGDSAAVSQDLLNNPDLVAQNGVISFKTALWFWMTAQSPKPSCHAVLTGGWTPSASDSSTGRTATFGMTTVIINGGLECGSGASNPSGNTSRMNLFSTMCSTFGVSPGSGTSCASMQPY
ncbi:hypothetical protein Mapa_013189 [Marchantia paleacea]|nr:hypothetical protein Mapa_013189 [Marchantia paleacea]